MLYAIAIVAGVAATFVVPDAEWWREWAALALAYTAGVLVEKADQR